MFKQMRTLNLKFFGMILFAIALLVGGFFLSTPSAGAVDKVQSFSAVYTLSPFTSQPNTDGGITTVINVGCSPLSGDKYDINTGKLCTGTPPKILIGCAPRSIDLYDINTGEKCKNKTTPVIIGCASGSGHIFDITTGKRCTNNTKPVISACKPGSGDLFNTTTGKPCPAVKSVALLSKPTQNVNINKDIISQVVKTTDTPISYIEPTETESLGIINDRKVGIYRNQKNAAGDSGVEYWNENDLRYYNELQARQYHYKFSSKNFFSPIKSFFALS